MTEKQEGKQSRLRKKAEELARKKGSVAEREKSYKSVLANQISQMELKSKTRGKKKGPRKPFNVNVKAMEEAAESGEYPEGRGNYTADLTAPDD